MKRLSLFFAATLIAAMSFAQSMTRTVATVEKIWSGEPLSWSTANTRQWTGYADGVYWNDKALHAIVGTHNGTAVDTILINDAIDGTAFCVDGAGNFVVEGPFPNTPTHLFLVKRADTTFVDVPIAGLGRTDIITATGDVFSADGGHVFVYGNSKNLLIVTIKNAGAANQEVTTKEIAIAGSNVQNFVVAGDTAVQYVMRRSAGQTGFDKYENGVNQGSIEGMTGYKQTTLAGAMVNLAGNELAIYPVGAVNYSSEFSIVNLTTGELAMAKDAPTQTTFCANTTTRANSTNVGVFVNATKIDDNSAYIQVGNGSDGTALFKVTVAQVSYCYLMQGNEGAEWTLMDATDNGFVYEGIYMADSLYINGAAAEEGAQKFTRANINYTGDVAVNDTVRFIYNDSIGAMSVVLLGKYVPKMTFNVKVPAGTLNCYIAGNFTDPQWGSFVLMTPVTDSTFTLTVTGDGVANAAAVEYKYTCGKDWAYVEKDANGNEIGNRHWAENDVVASWASVPVVNVISYVLDGGVTNDYGWENKSEMFASFMADAEALAGYKTLDEFLAMPEKLGDPGICKYLNNPEKAFANEAKWGWLKTYIAKVHAAQADDGASALPDNGAGAAWRYAIGAFFIDGQRATWPKSANFATCGVSTLAAYQSIWKGGFDNPSILADGETWTLTTPYKEGFTFDGWHVDSVAGAKVLSINDSTPTCTLYAKWIEYIPTIEEALAADSASVVKLGGVVTFIRGTKNVYVQDATGGVLLYTKSNATCQVGDFVVVTGNNIMYGGAPEIGSAEILRAEAGHNMPGEITTTIAALMANPLKYFCQRVKVEGVNIAKYDSKGNVFVTDGVDTVQCYYVTPNQTAFPVGAKVNLHLIAAYFNGFQFVGPNDGIEIASAAGVDPYQYPALGENGEYTLTNKWLYTTVMDNFSDNAPSPADYARGMVAKDGKMYFINRAIGGFTVVDGATGTMLDPIMITGDHLFQKQDTAGNWASAVTLAFNDVKLDQAGHFLIGACVSGDQLFQIYKVDINTGAATQVISERLYSNEEWGQQLDTATTKYRFDAFNVYGDVDGKAIVMAADANSFYVYKWAIEGGVAGKAERINCTPDPLFDESLLIKDGALSVTAFGTAPQVFPVDFNFFYVDGWSTLPMLFDEDGNLAEDFISCPTGVNIPMAGDTCTMNMGHNGLCEFQIGDEYFLVMAATNTVGTPTSAFAIYKFADASKSFDGLQPMWFFPKAGMGSLTNGCRTAVPSVEVDGTKATIYVYTHNNGYGVYEMTGLPSGLNNVNDDVKAVKIIENGQVYIIRNGVRYTVLGAQVK